MKTLLPVPVPVPIPVPVPGSHPMEAAQLLGCSQVLWQEINESGFDEPVTRHTTNCKRPGPASVETLALGSSQQSTRVIPRHADPRTRLRSSTKDNIAVFPTTALDKTTDDQAGVRYLGHR